MGTRKIVCIGGSSGSPMLAAGILGKLDADIDAAILLALHMPKALIKSFVTATNNHSKIEVKLAEDGMVSMPGVAYIAPGDMHIGVNKSRNIVVTNKPERAPFKPSIDVLFYTAAKNCGATCVGVILKGLTLKKDAVQGTEAIIEEGGQVFVQNDATDTLIGIPRDVVDSGIATEIGLLDIHEKISSLMGKQKASE
jgi:two-component system chemotaxis response regulator CheB